MKVLYLVNIPSPYRVDFFNELSKYCDLTVLYECSHSLERNDSWASKGLKTYQKVFLKGIRTGVNHAFSFEIIKYIKRFQNDVIVIGGYSTPTAMVAIAYMKLHKMKYYINADGGQIANDTKFRYKLKKMLIGNAAGYLSTGRQTDDYFAHYGANRANIYRYPFTSLLQKDVLQRPLHRDEKYLLREQLGLPKAPKIVIAVGRFIQGKGFDILLDIWEQSYIEHKLLLVGDGPLKTEYESRGVRNVMIIDFQKKEMLAKYYQASDVFVLPTRKDIWGLVINEAMANGLPVISTDKCVAAVELIEAHKNGAVVPSDDIEQLKQAIVAMLSADDAALYQIGVHNISKIQQWYTIEKMAQTTAQIFKEGYAGQ